MLIKQKARDEGMNTYEKLLVLFIVWIILALKCCSIIVIYWALSKSNHAHTHWQRHHLLTFPTFSIGYKPPPL